MATYTDSYLQDLITPALETRAAQDVAQLGTFPDPWPDRLTVLRAYILCCLESAATPEDVFSLKLSHYRKEYEAALPQARAAAATPAQTGLRIVFDLERA